MCISFAVYSVKAMRVEALQVMRYRPAEVRDRARSENPDSAPSERPVQPPQTERPKIPKIDPWEEDPRIIPGTDSLPQVAPLSADSRGRQERNGGQDLLFMIKPTADVIRPRIESAGTRVPLSGDLAPNIPLMLRPVRASRPRPSVTAHKG